MFPPLSLVSSMAHALRSHSYTFHPLEMSVVGYSGVGKTTLIERLLSGFDADWQLAYIKHDAHSFEMDKPGKDTYRARAAGAESVYISSPAAHAWTGQGQLSPALQRSILLDSDAVLIEGYKHLDLDKIVMLDREGKILEALGESSLERVIAFVGEGSLPPCSLPIDRPYCSRDAIDILVPFIVSHWREKAARRHSLRGLVLAGGQSRRMGSDKGLLHYRGEAQAIRTWRLLEECGLPSLISLRPDQWPDRSDWPCLDDRFTDAGPLGGIVSAMQTDPEASWLVLACDLPLLTPEVLQHLIASRLVHKAATAYRAAPGSNVPEPLCAIYEARLRMRCFESLALGWSCPRRILMEGRVQLIDSIDTQALTNVNDPELAHAIRMQLASWDR